MMPAAPKSTDEVLVTCGCGSSANEFAYKIAFWQFNKNNPEAKDLEIISFEKGFHGRLFSTLTTSHSKAVHRIAVPLYKWKPALFPNIKHPYHLHEAHNEQEEKRCLEYFSALFQKGNIAGVIIEPVLAEGGDKIASPSFYLGVQEIAKQNGAVFIVDEVQTGGGPTGRFWAHEHWGPRADPDIVTFAKKLQVTGMYYKSHLQVDDPDLLFNTYNSDHLRIMNFRAIWNTIQTDKLLRVAENTGMVLKAGLLKLAEKYPISGIRGLGTFLAYDLKDGETANALVSNLLKLGVNAGVCGDFTIRVRPTLIFREKHAELYLDRLELALQQLNK